MFRIACISIFRHGATALVLAAGVLAAGTTLAPRSAEAAVAANLQGYCNRHYPNSTFQLQLTNWGPRYLCRQVNANGYTLQNIDAGAVCREQTGNPAFKAYGRQVQCSGQAARQTTPAYNQQRQANQNWATLRAQQARAQQARARQAQQAQQAQQARQAEQARQAQQARNLAALRAQQDNLRRAQQANRNQATRQLPPAYRTVAPNLNGYCARVRPGATPYFAGTGWACFQRTTGVRFWVNPAAACQVTTGRASFQFLGNRRNIVCT